jgi:hypothetical protein
LKNKRPGRQIDVVHRNQPRNLDADSPGLQTREKSPGPSNRQLCYPCAACLFAGDGYRETIDSQQQPN